MPHFLASVVQAASHNCQAVASTRAVQLWCAIAISAILIPWLWYPAVGGVAADAVSAAEVFAGLWPLLIGAALAAALWRRGNRLPRIPEGDTIVDASFAACAPFERVDARLRQWPAGSVSLVATALILAAAAVFGR
jgi:hypothetical protein